MILDRMIVPALARRGILAEEPFADMGPERLASPNRLPAAPVPLRSGAGRRVAGIWAEHHQLLCGSHGVGLSLPHRRPVLGSSCARWRSHSSRISNKVFEDSPS